MPGPGQEEGSGAVSLWEEKETKEKEKKGKEKKKKSNDSYLVDPASSHMLVSKIKPCMSKYKRLYTVKLRMAH